MKIEIDIDEKYDSVDKDALKDLAENLVDNALRKGVGKCDKEVIGFMKPSSLLTLCNEDEFIDIMRTRQMDDETIAEFVDMNNGYVDFRNLLSDQRISENLAKILLSYYDFDSLSYLSNNFPSSEFIDSNMDKFMDNIDHLDYYGDDVYIIFWRTVSAKSNLDENFLRKYKDKIVWEKTIKAKQLSEDLLEEVSEYIDWADVMLCQNMSEDFIIKHKEDINKWCKKYHKIAYKDVFIRNEATPKLINEFSQYFDEGDGKYFRLCDNE